MSASHYLVTEKPELADFLGWSAYIDLHRESTLEKNVTGSADLSPAEDLMKKYPGMSRELAEQIANDPNPERKAQSMEQCAIRNASDDLSSS